MPTELLGIIGVTVGRDSRGAENLPVLEKAAQDLAMGTVVIVVTLGLSRRRNWPADVVLAVLGRRRKNIASIAYEKSVAAIA